MQGYGAALHSPLKAEKGSVLGWVCLGGRGFPAREHAPSTSLSLFWAARDSLRLLSSTSSTARC